MLPSTTFPRGVSTLHTDASGTAPPDAFGPFRVLHQIGVGVLGPVFRAYQPDPGRLVAVKQFRLDLPPESAHRFVAALEQLVAADLTHLGIAAPLAAGLVENSPFLAMDFAAAESFDVVVRDYGPASVSEALRIATQLGGALDFAAAVDVFHGSLHPRDVLVSTDDTRVTGLGIAHALEQVGLLPPIRRPYTAPERIAGLAWDRRADTFSLAALVYEMLFGRRIAGLGADAAEAIPSTEGMDVHAMRALFARALAEDPAERFDTALGFADALHNAAAQPEAPAAAPKARGRRKTSTEPPSSAPQSARPALPLEPEPDLPLASAADSMALDLAPAVESLDLARNEEPARGDGLSLAEGDELSLAEEALDPTPPLAPDPEPDIEAIVAKAERAVAESPLEPIAADTGATVRSAADERPLSIDTEREPLRALDDTHPADVDAGLHEGLHSDLFAHDISHDRAGFDDVELRRAEADRYALVDDGLSALPEATVPVEPPVRPTIVEPPVATPLPRPEPEAAPVPALAAPTFSSVALEQSRSAIWPLVLALVVGLLVGFAFGYGAGTRGRVGPASQSASVEAPAAEPPSAEPSSPPATATTQEPSPTPATGDAVRQTPESADRRPGTNAPPAATAAPGAAAARPRPSAPERTVPERGRLLVRSTPAGARVLLDGRDVGETPVTLSSVDFGTHVVRITHQGYVAAERRVRIRSAQPAQSIEVALAATRPARGATPAPAAPERTSGSPAAKAGSLMVDSRPVGARVFVDGQMVGTTPLLLDPVTAGDHSVRLELDGFNGWATTTRVVGGERNRVSGSLEQR